MKKISLSNIRSALKRDEMRQISGGSGSGGGTPYCLFNSCISNWNCCSGTTCQNQTGGPPPGFPNTGVCLF